MGGACGMHEKKYSKRALVGETEAMRMFGRRS
jgi:hypothetical protein